MARNKSEKVSQYSEAEAAWFIAYANWLGRVGSSIQEEDAFAAMTPEQREKWADFPSADVAKIARELRDAA